MIKNESFKESKFSTSAILNIGFEA